MGQFRGVELNDVEPAGERLVLRRWRPDDAERVHTIMQDASMHEFLALPDPYTRADAEQFVTELGHEGRADGTGLGCAIVERSGGRLVGSAALRLAGDAEIGYWVAPDAWGRGYAAEACDILSRWGFAVGLHRVRLACDVRNLASARTALAAGFQFEGIGRDGIAGTGYGRVPDRRADLARFARLASDPPERVPYAFPPLPSGGLSDGVLRLRTMRADDAPGVAESDDELTLRWSFTGQPRTPDDARREAERAGLQWLVGPVARMTMLDLATGGFAGSLQVRRSGPPQVGGVGYVVHPAFRGRRYASRALRLLVPWAFEAADFARLELGAKEGNDPSLRAALNGGFEPEGVLRRRLRNPDGSFSDEVRYALINPTYA